MSKAIFIDGVDCSPENVRDWIEQTRRLEARLHRLELYAQSIQGKLVPKAGVLAIVRGEGE